MLLSFSKYTGLGNDFIFIDNRHKTLTPNAELVKKLCHRTMGIGGDGTVFLEESQIADYRMRIFNADGSEAEMCGNALRSMCLFLEELGLEQKEGYYIQTFERTLFIKRVGDLVSCDMGEIKDIELNKHIQLANSPITGHFLNTGVPHFVIFSSDINKVDVEEVGKAISFHPAFMPKRTNVNFIDINSQGEVLIRTFERGVEAETFACGTGAAASAIVAHLVVGLASPVYVRTKLGEYLKFEFDSLKGQISNFKMIGPATHVFKGSLMLSEFLVKA